MVNRFMPQVIQKLFNFQIVTGKMPPHSGLVVKSINQSSTKRLN